MLPSAVTAQSTGRPISAAAARPILASGLGAPVVTSYTVTATYSGSDTETWKGGPRDANGSGNREFSFSESETATLYATKPSEVYFVTHGAPSITADATLAQTYPAPNSALTCTGTFSAEARPQDPFVW